MTSIREQCGCGSSIRVKHPDPAPIAAEWRSSHPCDRRGGERDITAGATADIAYSEPHPTDSQVHDRPGFRRRGRLDDTEPLGIDSSEVARVVNREARMAPR